MKMIIGLVLGFMTGVGVIAWRAEGFCRERGFENWDASGCFNKDNKYEYNKD